MQCWNCRGLGRNRQKLWQQLDSTMGQQWDMIVIGGGITGAAVLREALRQGWKTLLIEQSDFARGSTNQCSNTDPGGLRLLAQGDFTLSKQSLNEQERLLCELPGLIDRQGYYQMSKCGKFPAGAVMNLALSIYNTLAGAKNKTLRHRYCNREELAEHFREIDQSILHGATYYSDAVTDDARLVLRILYEAVRSGGYVLNYARVRVLPKRGANQQLVIEDTQTGDCLKLRTKVIVNTTDIQVNQFNSLPSSNARPLRGSHIIVAHEKLPVDEAITVCHPTQRRPVFIIPWEGVTVIGSTDFDHHGKLCQEPRITSVELDYLRDTVTQFFPHYVIKRADVISTFASIKPVIAGGICKASLNSRRDHALQCNDAVINVSGGKLTTFRLIAQDVVRAARQWLPSYHAIDPRQRFFYASTHSPSRIAHHDKRWLKRLFGRYGDSAKAMLQQATPPELEKIPGTEYCLAECRWSLRYEAVVHLDDLLLRRTRLGLLLKNGAEQLLGSLQPLCCTELNWDLARWSHELERYRHIIKHYYSLPARS